MRSDLAIDNAGNFYLVGALNQNADSMTTTIVTVSADGSSTAQSDWEGW